MAVLRNVYLKGHWLVCKNVMMEQSLREKIVQQMLIVTEGRLVNIASSRAVVMVQLRLARHVMAVRVVPRPVFGKVLRHFIPQPENTLRPSVALRISTIEESMTVAFRTE